MEIIDDRDRLNDLDMRVGVIVFITKIIDQGSLLYLPDF